jgi:hypothetical protein
MARRWSSRTPSSTTGVSRHWGPSGMLQAILDLALTRRVMILALLVVFLGSGLLAFNRLSHGSKRKDFGGSAPRGSRACGSNSGSAGLM